MDRRSTRRPPTEDRTTECDDTLHDQVGFVRALAASLVADPARADDLAQDTLVAAVQRDRTESSGRGGLATVTRRLAANLRRGDHRRARRERAAARPEAVASHTEAVERLELARAVADLVIELDQPYRTVIYLRYHEGLGPTAIADRLGIPTKTVKTRLHRALTQLRGRLDTRPGGRSAWIAGLSVYLAPALPAPSAITPPILTGLAMKKLATGAAALLLLWFGLRTLTPGSPDATPSANATTTGATRTASSIAPTTDAPPPPTRVLREPTPRPAPAETEIADPATGDLFVRLLWDDDGSPAAGLRVDVCCRADPAPRDRCRTATTDSSGHLALPNLFAGRVLLRTALGHRFDADVRPGGHQTEVIRLDAGDAVDGSVVDVDGNAVARATVWSVSSSDLWPRAVAVARTGTDGRFRLDHMPADGQLGARATGHSPSLVHAVEDLPADERGVRSVTLQLGGAGGRVRGIVVDPGGEPVVGASVLVGPRGGASVDLASGERATRPGPASATTGDDGTFVCPGDVPTGEQPLHVLASGFPQHHGSVSVPAGGDAYVRVVLSRPAIVRGRVVDPRGTPVAGATVVAAEVLRGGWVRTMFGPSRDDTDGEGSFTLDWVAPGAREINAWVEREDRQGRARATVECLEASVVEIELVLELGATITGRVVDDRTGEALVGWGVHASSPMGLGYPRRDRTDPDGSFVLANLASTPYDVRVAAPGEFFYPPRAIARGITDGTHGLEIRVADTETSAPATVLGCLLDARGLVPRDARVTLWKVPGDAGTFVDVDAEDGTFHHRVTRPGSYQLRVLRGGQTVANSDVFDLHPGGVHDVGLLQLGAPGSILVTVEGADEEELHNLLVLVERDGAATEILTRDGDVFRSRPLSTGTWTTCVRNTSLAIPDVVIDVEPGGVHEAVLRAQPGSEVDLRLSFADPAKGVSVQVHVLDSTGDRVRSIGPLTTSRLGGDTLSAPELILASGHYTLEARSADGRLATASLVVPPRPARPAPVRMILR